MLLKTIAGQPSHVRIADSIAGADIAQATLLRMQKWPANGSGI
jgi:hypothetical protein